MKFSVVTISYNQAKYLRDCLESVFEQKSPNYEIEYIVVDPGSTDGSRQILKDYSGQICHCIFEGDAGPADGLNKGFSRATGDIYFYLNSDDICMPGAFQEAARLFSDYPDVDVVSGAGVFIDTNGRRMRRIWPDPIGRIRIAYGGGILVQPATFIRASAFQKVNGFNPQNHTNWDGELVTDLFLSGAKFRLANKIWGGYRLHPTSITSSGKLVNEMSDWTLRRRKKLGVNFSPSLGRMVSLYFRAERVFRHPSIILGRITHGRVFGGGAG